MSNLRPERGFGGQAGAVLKLLPGKSSKEDGKKWLPVWLHAIDTEGIMRRLLFHWLPPRVKQSLGGEKGLWPVCSFLALTHDIGKLTPAFLTRILPSLCELKDSLEGVGLRTDFQQSAIHIHHTLTGAAILKEAGCPAGVIAVVGAHHGKPISQEEDCDLEQHTEIHPQSYFGSGGRGNAQGRLWAEVRRLWLEEALRRSGYGSAQEIHDLNLCAQMLLTGLLIMADWIASDREYFPLLELEDVGENLDLEQRANQGWERFRREHSWEPPATVPNREWFESAYGFAPNPEQEAVLLAAGESLEPGIYILEAQMGRGKTEAALACAELLAGKLGCGGLFFGLPTQATANGLFPRLKTWGLRQAKDMDLTIRLAHGMAAFHEEYRSLPSGGAVDEDGEGGLLVHPWFSGRKQALLSDFVIGTVDQLLMASLKRRHLMLRHLGLAGKVVIVDECHAYDAYMNQYLDRTLNWLGAYGVPVILLSATLPSRRRAELIDAYRNGRQDSEEGENWRDCLDYPLLTWTQGQRVCQKVIPRDGPSREVAIGRLSEEELAVWLGEKLSQGGCAGVIVNTVGRAQEIAKLLAEALPDTQVELYHSRFLLPDRADREAKLVDRVGKGSTPETRNHRIIVGTQVLEQSLDLDFDCMVTDLCPMDLLLQRIGRLHRHRRERPEKLRCPVCMMMGAGETLEPGSRMIYGEWLLRRTRENLPDKLLLPDSIPVLVQQVYAIPDLASLDPEAKAAWEKHDNRRKDRENRADGFRLGLPDEMEDFPELNTINGMLDTDVIGSDTRAEARVRDGESCLSVLVMVRDRESRVFFLPWQEGGREVPTDRPPEEPLARAIAAQKLQLPRVLSLGSRAETVLNELEKENRVNLPGWQHSGWLRDELVLLLEEDLSRELAGYSIQYDLKWGLICQKKEAEGQ